MLRNSQKIGLLTGYDFAGLDEMENSIAGDIFDASNNQIETELKTETVISSTSDVPKSTTSTERSAPDQHKSHHHQNHHSNSGVSHGRNTQRIAALTPHHQDKGLSSKEREEIMRRKVEEQWTAQKHIRRVNVEAKCKVPRPKVIHIQDVYPNASKTYLPHCTVLHQCGTDTGCCENDRHVCRAKTTERIELYFYTQSFIDPSQKIEKLEFFNHTECECREDRQPRHSNVQIEVPTIDSMPLSLTMMRSEDKCVCPKKFSVHRLDDGTCVCDCFVGQKDCLQQKRGKLYFSREDQMCIKNLTCLLPSCQFGQYLRKNARCVKKEEFNFWPKRYS